MAEEITGLSEAVSSIVNKLVENEGASFPFLVAGGFTFPINLVVVEGSGKGYLAVIGAGEISSLH